jgi:hypothetical protein
MGEIGSAFLQRQRNRPISPPAFSLRLAPCDLARLKLLGRISGAVAKG